MARFFVITFALWVASMPAGSAPARILGFFPAASKSDLIVHCAIADALAQAGHDVTVLGAIPNLNAGARYHFIHIDVPGLDPAFITRIVNDRSAMHQSFHTLIEHVLSLSNNTLTHPTTQQFLRQHGAGSFDLLLLGYFLNDFQLGLAAHFRCPVVLCFATQPLFSVNSMLGNPAELAYVPTVFSNLKQPMGFGARVKNFLISALEEHVVAGFMRRRQLAFYDYHFPADRYPTFDEMLKNVSLVFVNHHFTQGPIRPNVPNLIEIGGIHVKDQPDLLPQDLATVLSAKAGVVYFSLGTVADGANLAPDRAKVLFDALSRLPQQVVWKWGGGSDVPGQSPNIFYKDWLPQDEILAHRNVKLFITHCGQGSMVQSQYHGVSMLGIPLFGDQPSNAVSMERAGFGLSVDYLTMTADSLHGTITTMLQNRTYAASVQRFSRLYRDRPQTPRETVVYWAEYVLRYRGASHLQSPAVHLNSWQLLSLDVIACLLFIVATVVATLVAMCRMLCCRGGRQRAGYVTKTKKHE